MTDIPTQAKSAVQQWQLLKTLITFTKGLRHQLSKIVYNYNQKINIFI